MNEPCELTIEETNNLNLIKRHQNILVGDKKLGINMKYKNTINQYFGSFTFFPSPNAKADEQDCFGYIRLTGNFGSLKECKENATLNVQTQDQLSEQIIVEVGRPYPLLKNYDNISNIEKVRVEKINQNFVDGYKNFEKSELDKDGKNEMDTKIEKLRKEAVKEETDYDNWAKLVSMNAWFLKNIKNFKTKIFENFTKIEELEINITKDDLDKFYSTLQKDFDNLKFDDLKQNEEFEFYKIPKTIVKNIFVREVH